jgi:hypothetical protein
MASVLALGAGIPAGLVSATQEFVAHAAPYPNADRVVSLARGGASSGQFFTIDEFWSLRAQSQAVALGAFSVTRVAATQSRGSAERRAVRASPEFLRLFGLSVSSGSDLTRPMPFREALVTGQLWKELGFAEFARGNLLLADGELYEIVGLLPDVLQRPFDAEIWLPLPSPQSAAASGRFLTIIAAVPEGSSSDRLVRAIREATGEQSWVTTDFRRTLVGRKAAIIQTLNWVAVFIVIATALVLSIVAAVHLWWQRQVIGVLSSIGSSPSATACWVLSELLVAASIGIVAGAWVGTMTLVTTLSALGHVPGPVNATTVSWLGAAVTGSAVACLGSSVIVVLGLAGRHPVVLIGAMSSSARWLSSARVGVTAISTVAIVVVFNGLGQAVGVARVNIGFDPTGVFYQRVRVAKVEADRAADPVAAVEQAFSGAGYSEVAVVSSPPLVDPAARTTVVADDGSREIRAILKVVSPTYFKVMRMPFVSGDTVDANGLTAVVNRSAASRLWSDGNYRGRAVRLGPVRLPVSGVVADSLDDPLSMASDPILFVSLTFGIPKSFVVIARRGSATRTRDGLGEVEWPHSLAPGDSRELQQVVNEWLRPHHLTLWLASAALVCCAGLMTATSYFTALLFTDLERRACAIRAALGATPGALVRLMVGKQIKLDAIGTALGATIACLLVWPLHDMWIVHLAIAGGVAMLSGTLGVGCSVGPTMRRYSATFSHVLSTGSN